MRQRLIKEVNKLKVGQRIFASDDDNDDKPVWAPVMTLDSGGFVIRWDHNGVVARKTLEDITRFSAGPRLG